MLTTDLSSAAIELCTEVAVPLTADEQSILATMLAREPDGSWTHAHHVLPRDGTAIVQARILAALLLDEGAARYPRVRAGRLGSPAHVAAAPAGTRSSYRAR